MFVPPPVQLSREEIQNRIEGEKQRREQANFGGPKAPSDLQSAPLHRKASRSPTSPRWNHYFGKGERPQVSAPFAVSQDSPPERHCQPNVRDRVRNAIEAANALPAGFGENPRKAPTPPKRPGTRPSDLWTPSLPGAFPEANAEGRDEEHPPPPPAIKSPMRQTADKVVAHISDVIQNEQDVAFRPQRPYRFNSDNETGAAGNAMPWTAGPQRALTVPPSTDRTPHTLNNRTGSARLTSRNAEAQNHLYLGEGVSGFGQSNARGHGAQKPAANRRSIYAAIPGDGAEMDSFLEIETASHTEGDATGSPQVKSSVRTPGQAPSPRFMLIDKALPNTPSSIIATPTELYQAGLADQTLSFRSPGHSSQRNPLMQLSPVNAKSDCSKRKASEMSPSRLSSIPEYTNASDESPLSSDARLPQTTRIHVRGGSVVSVIPPELSPWQQMAYMQGPIKLPTPVIVPRKNSVASLEPFQEAIDTLYQDTLVFSRRQSDDTVLDDVCEYFDCFDFADLNFQVDVKTSLDMSVWSFFGSCDDSQSRDGRCSTTAGEENVSPVEKLVAKGIAEAMTSLFSATAQPPPPVENEETLRAKGIASLAHRSANLMPHRRGDSATLTTKELTLLPDFEQGLAEAAEQISAHDGSITMEKQPEAHGLEPVEDVKELDAASKWVAPAAFGLGRGPSIKASRDPVTLMQRLMASASAGL